ncbi:ComF family protein [Pseudodesulfovibrio portus]|uniref:Phosphoribosyltransferase domain-containing protein n=1 Tax=Pseudodesulfovibrio portus TaxID=231439 RepID=A0ABN6RU21_9BACT|nr:ComF family protein [Pseudodesulfovibrio portus]BDQ33545.1 hypothetical protein JCM14722_10870 [Pseudodesulfovibrio portus]
MIPRILDLARRIGLTARRCPACGAVTHAPAKTDGNTLCADCARAMAPRTGGYCPGCGHMSGRKDDPPSLCPECRRTPPPWARLHFHGKYADPLRTLILGYKFGGGFGHARLLADMAERAFNGTGNAVPDVIVPVPLHSRRLMWRGFNQATEMSRLLSRKLGRPMLQNGLVRTRNTVPQTRLGHRERQANIKDAFTADPGQVRGKTVLLVDDVYTTGATLRECARTLNRAGAAAVEVLVLARAQQEPC